MISETMCGLGKESSVIRAISEYGNTRSRVKSERKMSSISAWGIPMCWCRRL